jgi:hypothetical protein
MKKDINNLLSQCVMDNAWYKRVLFVFLFVLFVFIGKRINFSALVGADNQFFTLFQFFGPIAGGFLGLFGVVAVLFAQIIDMLVVGKAFTLVNVVRLAPMLFGALFFGLVWKKRELNRFVLVSVPVICIVLFVMHPVGGTVWYFSLYWLIPVIVALLPNKVPGKLLWRSYGATFMAHAVGGAIWVWTVPMAAEQWIALIPIVAFERFLFGLGIAGSYVLVNSVLDYAVEKFSLDNVLNVDKQYVLSYLLYIRR